MCQSLSQSVLSPKCVAMTSQFLISSLSSVQIARQPYMCTCNQASAHALCGPRPAHRLFVENEQHQWCAMSEASAVAMGLSALCLDLWTSVCLCQFALFKGFVHVLGAFHSADIGAATDTASSHSATHALCLRSSPAVRTVITLLSVTRSFIVSYRCYKC